MSCTSFHTPGEPSARKRSLCLPTRPRSLRPVPSPSHDTPGLPLPASPGSSVAGSDDFLTAPSRSGRARSITVSAVSSALHVRRRTPRLVKDGGASTPDVSRTRSGSCASSLSPFGHESNASDRDAFDAVVNSSATVKLSLTPTRLRTLETRARSSSSPPPSPTMRHKSEQPDSPVSLKKRAPALRRNSTSLAVRRRGRVSTEGSTPPLPTLRLPSPQKTPHELQETLAHTTPSEPRQSWEHLPPLVQREGLAWEKAVYLDTPASSSSSLAQSEVLCSSVSERPDTEVQDMEVLSSPLPSKPNFNPDETAPEVPSNNSLMKEELAPAAFSNTEPWTVLTTDTSGPSEEIWSVADRWEQVANAGATHDLATPSSPLPAEWERPVSPHSTHTRPSQDNTLTWDDVTVVQNSVDARSLLSSLLAGMESFRSAEECRTMLKHTLGSLDGEHKQDISPRSSSSSTHLHKHTLHRSKVRIRYEEAYDPLRPTMSGGLRALARAQASGTTAPRSVSFRSLV